jgi:hypothetical protein
MATKKYLVRDGFVVVLKIARADGGFTERTFTSGDEVQLEDGDFSLHAHKLEFSSQKDRDAALAAEKTAAAARVAAQPVDVIKQLADLLALAVSQTPAATAPAA